MVPTNLDDAISENPTEQAGVISKPATPESPIKIPPRSSYMRYPPNFDGGYRWRSPPPTPTKKGAPKAGGKGGMLIATHLKGNRARSSKSLASIPQGEAGFQYYVVCLSEKYSISLSQVSELEIRPWWKNVKSPAREETFEERLLRGIFLAMIGFVA